MNYERQHHSGNRRRRDDRDYDRRPQTFETPGAKLRMAVVKLGEEQEFDPPTLLSRVASTLRDKGAEHIPVISEGFRIGVTEQPYKIPYYAALLAMMYSPADDAPSGEATSSMGKTILEDFLKGFQAFLDKLAWRDLRLCIHFFAHLTLAGVISPSSMSAFLQSFADVLEEPGVSYGRASQASLCVGEGLMRVGPTLYLHSERAVSGMIASLTNFSRSTASAKTLVLPILHSYSEENTDGRGTSEPLEDLLSALNELSSSQFSTLPSSLPRPLDTISFQLAEGTSMFELPNILVPPEAIELDGFTADGDLDKPTRKDDLPQCYLRLFEDQVTPNAATPAGYVVRAGLADVISICEVNRKECARILLEMPRWWEPGTFRNKAGAAQNGSAPSDQGWQLETAIIENVLSAAFVLPQPAYPPMYYFALITEICKLSPPTVGPAVGKSIRKLYSLVGEGLDVEVVRRFAEWFSIHMSNFNFQWVWKEWIPDLELSPGHPRKSFIRRVLDLEIRLSYHDRIMQTLPKDFQDPSVGVMPDQPPGPEFAYELPNQPHHEAAKALLDLLKGRSKADEVLAHIEALRTTLIESSDPHPSTIVRSITVHCLLMIGSRSFSHFLNGIERYISLLRALSIGADAKAEILQAVSEFWSRNQQMVSIVFDKLMQYQIVDPVDVIAWIFNSSKDGLNMFRWDLMKSALDKANGRVSVAKKKVALLRKEEDDARARAKAGDGMDVDDTKDDEPVVDSPALTTALKAYATLTRDQKSALSRALDGFVAVLKSAENAVSEDAWTYRVEWNKEWAEWEAFGWFKHFTRLYAPYLRTYSFTLDTAAGGSLGSSPQENALRRIWSVAVDGHS